MKSIHLFIISLFVSVSFAGIVFADTTYTIKKGDTPDKIAKRFKISSKAILQANNVKATGLRPGKKILIPSKKSKSVSKCNSKSGKKTSEKITRTVQHQGFFHPCRKKG